MAIPSKKPGKKKMSDISRPVAVRVNKTQKPAIKNIESELKELDKKVEEFEKKEEKQFHEEETREIGPRKLKTGKSRLKKTLILVAAAVFIGAGVFAAIRFLPRVDIEFVTKKSEWNYVNSIVASKNADGIDAVQKRIPAEIFSTTKDFNFSYPATGKKNVQQKAGGAITIYNSYSSDSQVLSATTRFAAPDGKIFRLVQKTTVPGAKIADGKIVASSIDAQVAADQAGPDYNIGPVSRFSIPGFAGTPKYQGFYAESKESMKGGFIGEVAYPTDQDIKAAKQKSLEELKNSEKSFLSLQMPAEFKVIDGAEQFTVLKQEVNAQTDDKNNFTVFSQAQLSDIAFRESDFIALAETLARTDLGIGDLKAKTYQLDYGAGRPDFKQGEISFAVNFKGVFEEPLDADSLIKNAANKSESDLRALVLTLPGIEKITISFWPFWVKRAPNDTNRIKVNVE